MYKKCIKNVKMYKKGKFPPNTKKKYKADNLFASMGSAWGHAWFWNNYTWS